MFRTVFVVLVLMASMLFSTMAAAKQLLPIDIFSKGREYNQVKISPTGKYLAFVSKHDGKNVLIFLGLNDFKVRYIVNFPNDGEVGNYEWVSEDRVVLQKQYISGWEAQPKYYGELFGINADGSRAKYLVGYKGTTNTGTRARKATSLYGTSYILDPLVHDDDKALIVTYPWSGSSEPVTHVYELNIHTGKRNRIAASPKKSGHFLTDHQGEVRIVWVSADDGVSSEIHVRSRKEPDWKALKVPQKLAEIDIHGFDKSGERVYVTGSYEGEPKGVFSLNLTTNELESIYQDKQVDPTQLWIDPADKTLFAIELDPGYPTYAFPKENSVRKQQLKSLLASIPGNQVQIVSATKDGSQVVVFAHSDVNPGNYYLYDTKKNSLGYLASSRKWIDPKQMSAMEPVEYQSRDGKTIHGYLTVPNGMDKKNLPLVVMPHGGPHYVRDMWLFDSQVQLLASRGIAVLQVNFRGSEGYGTSFERAGFRKWGKEIQHDIIDGVKYLFDKGIADKKRACIMGASFGGYSALQSAILEPEMFQCAIGVMGVYDLPMMFEEGDVAERDSGIAYLNTVLGQNEAQLKAFSPVYNVDKLIAPVFIVHGGEDERAPIEHAEVLVKALKKADKEYNYYVLESEGHGFYKPEHRKVYYEKVLAFLSQHLKL